ncbi:MAG: hypothetical protein ACYSX0_15935 [Planctomycetota bacterium]|jgi:hypothetical protein
MRMFLPIKGPGGRALTPREKVALLTLGITLVLCLLTLLAGESAYGPEPARNPVFALVGALCRALGGGIVALYGLILVWSGLIYFKGENIADVSPLPGRLLAAIGVAIGISGALGIAQLDSAGSLGSFVGGALENTLGGAIGVPILLLIMLLGFHLAGQGAWSALREPTTVMALAGPGLVGASGAAGYAQAQGRGSSEPPLPDDGDPSPAERSNAVTRAMEEIERYPGVTIVDVEPGALQRASIGEEVETAPDPEPETEEAEVQRGLAAVDEALVAEEQEEEEADAPEDYEVEDHGLVPVQGEEFEVDSEEEDSELEEEEDCEDEEEEQAPDGDPYARGGLIRRLRTHPQRGGEGDRPYTSFDWRGRPLD